MQNFDYNLIDGIRKGLPMGRHIGINVQNKNVQIGYCNNTNKRLSHTN